ncbi:MAG: thioredoxin domain-containing protein, partial [Clostridia bacterium]|nr:thioredoxin domain-containing protein [Clostridia bacterium]
IGYSSCHWCHVMAHESIENNEIAKILNEFYVSIKVDREERTDIDAVYMEVCQKMTGSGGWPLNLLLTPSKEPFFAGTYIPAKTSGYGNFLLLYLLKSAAAKWRSNPELIKNTASAVKFRVNEPLYYEKGENLPPDEETVYRKTFEELKLSYDSKYGGFGIAPKFPSVHNLMFLLRYAKTDNVSEAANMVFNTLECMYRGGIYDHPGGGFSRYSTDREWLIPHFEKMLYDNAMLAWIYTEAYAVTKQTFFMDVAVSVADYVIRELKNEKEAYYGSQDADIGTEEGKYYTFTRNELMQLLGNSDGEIFCSRYGIYDKGNFENGLSVPNLLDESRFLENTKHENFLCRSVYSYRKSRYGISTDDKILTAWNSMFISALCKIYAMTGNVQYLKNAYDAEAFIAKNLICDDRLYVRWCKGERAVNGKLEDYAFYIMALIDLYKVSFNAEYLLQAVKYAEITLALFFDEKEGGFYIYSSEDEKLLTRPKLPFDTAMPSGNSVMVYVLLNLFHLTANHEWKDAYDKQRRYMLRIADEYPAAACFSLYGMLADSNETMDIVCTNPTSEDIKKFAEFSVSKPPVFTVIKSGDDGLLEKAAPFTKYYENKKRAFYICKNGKCTDMLTGI